MFYLVNTVIYCAVALGVLFSGRLQVDGDLLLLICLLTNWAVTHYSMAYKRAESENDIRVLIKVFVGFFWIAYVFKLAYILFFPELLWVVPDVVSLPQIWGNLAYSFFIASIGYTGLMLGLVSVQQNAKMYWRQGNYRPRLYWFFLLAGVLFVLKLVLKSRFHIGVPGIEPESLGIPMLSGVLALLINTGSFLFVNLLFFSVLRRGGRVLVLAALLIVSVNAGIDLMHGSKQIIIYQVIVTLAYLYIFIRRENRFDYQRIKKGLRLVALFTILLVAFIGLAYKYMNYYRFALLAGEDKVGAAIELAVSNERAMQASAAVQFYNRINGLENLAAAIAVIDTPSRELQPEHLIDGEITNQFSENIMGGKATSTLFGVTQFGYVYLAVGATGLFIAMFVLLKVFVWLQRRVLFSVAWRDLRIAAYPVMMILFLKVLLGSGDLILWGKEIIMFFIVLWATARLLVVPYRQGSSADLKLSETPLRQGK